MNLDEPQQGTSPEVGARRALKSANRDVSIRNRKTVSV